MVSSTGCRCHPPSMYPTSWSLCFSAGLCRTIHPLTLVLVDSLLLRSFTGPKLHRVEGASELGSWMSPFVSTTHMATAAPNTPQAPRTVGSVDISTNTSLFRSSTPSARQAGPLLGPGRRGHHAWRPSSIAASRRAGAAHVPPCGRRRPGATCAGRCGGMNAPEPGQVPHHPAEVPKLRGEPQVPPRAVDCSSDGRERGIPRE